MSNVVVVHPRHPASEYRSSFLVVGILQVLAGLICAVLGIVLTLQVNARTSGTNSNSGIGTGILYVITGILALSAGKSPGSCNVVAGMIFAILSAISSGVVVALGSFSLHSTNRGSSEFDSLYAIVVVLVIACALEFIFSLAHAVISCRGSCCAPSTSYRAQAAPPKYPNTHSSSPAYGQTNISGVNY